MTGKILCLHGYGLNGEALMSLLAELRQSFGDSYEFVCPDGELECTPPKEIGNLYSPPHCGFHPQFPVEDEVREAHDYLYDLIDNEGPFEGILGFSQGAEVAASILFTEAMQPDSQRPKPLFKFAVFIGGFPPWDIYGATNHGDKGTTPLRPVLPITHAARIDIPTVHIMGRKDGYRVHAKFLLGLCNERKAKVYDHQGSHMIPRGEMAMENLTSALNWVIDRSIFQ